MKIKAKGILRHHFWGEYSAQITLMFESEYECDLALPKLEEMTGEPGSFRNACGGTSDSLGWARGETNKNLCAIILAGDKLDNLVSKLKELGACDTIDSCSKSIDHGDAFEILMEVEDPKQMKLI